MENNEINNIQLGSCEFKQMIDDQFKEEALQETAETQPNNNELMIYFGDIWVTYNNIEVRFAINNKNKTKLKRLCDEYVFNIEPDPNPQNRCNYVSKRLKGYNICRLEDVMKAAQRPIGFIIEPQPKVSLPKPVLDGIFKCYRFYFDQKIYQASESSFATIECYVNNLLRQTAPVFKEINQNIDADRDYILF